MFDLLAEIGQTLRNNRLRTMLTGLSVAWGVFMLIVLLGAARGVSNAFTESNDAASTNVINIWGGMTTLPWQGYKEGRSISLKSSDIARIEQENEPVYEVVAYGSIDTAQVSTVHDAISGSFNAVYPSERELRNIAMTAGRFINDRDIADARRVMVLHSKNAATLFPGQTPDAVVGQRVDCLGLVWTVVGVYDHDWISSSYTPYTTYKAITGNDDTAYQLTARISGLSSAEEGEKIERDIRGSLARAHGFNPADQGAVWTWNRFTQAVAGAAAMGYLSLAVWILGFFTLVSGIVGVSNIMFVSVRERTHEIGIRRAIGAKPRSILTQILAEGVAITALFGYIGIVFGMAVLQVVDHFFGDTEAMKNPTVDISIAVQVTIALIIAGALAGLFPALKAIKVKPVEALRDE